MMPPGAAGGGFQELLQQAAALKGEQVKAERRKFEAQPVFLQNTLFHCRHEAVQEARALEDLEARLEAAARFKEEGNALFAKGDLLEANDMYERCIGCFWFIETSEPDFKEKGVKDEYLTFRQDHLDDDRVKKLLAAALVNAASCHQKFANWTHCVQNCTHAIDLDETNVKALYRRAQARTIPVSCGALDLDLAIKDLKCALGLKPDDRALRKMHAELVSQRARQRESDKKTFSGIFEKADLAADEDPSRAPNSADKENAGSSARNGAAAKSSQSAEQEIRMYKDVAASLRRQGRDTDAAQVEEAVAKAEENLARKKILGSNSFESPTPEMIREAKEEHGIDLTDPEVQAELRRQWKRRAEGLGPEETGADDVPPAQEEMSDNRISMYVLIVGVIATLIFSGLIPWLAARQQHQSEDLAFAGLGAHPEDEL